MQEESMVRGPVQLRIFCGKFFNDERIKSVFLPSKKLKHEQHGELPPVPIGVSGLVAMFHLFSELYKKEIGTQ